MPGRLRSSTSRACNRMRVQTLVMVCLLAPRLLSEVVGQVDLSAWRKGPPVEVQPGDLVFRRDNGVWSWFFIQASRRERRFSHVGIVVEGGASPFIVHADASELTGVGCVRRQRWSEFFAESLDGAVYRYEGTRQIRERIAAEALRRLGVPFDTGFDMTSTNKLYCSELVRESVNGATGLETIGYTRVAALKSMIAVDDCYATNMVKVAECRK